MSEKTYSVEVETVRQETPSIRVIRLRFAAHAEFTFYPGQWVTLQIPGSEERPLPYSIASSPLERKSIEVALTRGVGPSARLFDLQPGEPVILTGPLGNWIYSEKIKHAALIAGGTGVAPFRSMFRYVVERKLSNELTLMISAPIPAEILFRSEWEHAVLPPNIRVFLTATRWEVGSSPEQWSGWTGRLDGERIHSAVADSPRLHYFLCGSPEFVESIWKELKNTGVPDSRIHRP